MINSPRPIPYAELIAEFPFLENNMNLEDGLDMELAEVYKPPTLPVIVDFSQIVKLRNGNFPHPPNAAPVACIKNTAFEKLYKEALKLRKPGEQHVTALRISFGLTNTSHEVKLLFQAVYAKLDTGKDYDVIENGEIYYYDEPSCTFELYALAEDVRRNYRRNVLVKHVGDQSPTAFIEGIDTESVTFPFQTIYTLMYDNRPDDYILIYNALPANKEMSEVEYKHGLLLTSSDEEREKRKLLDFKNKYANRSHLCPPGCNKLRDLDVIIPRTQL